jgi:hypothetical protein
VWPVSRKTSIEDAFVPVHERKTKQKSMSHDENTTFNKKAYENKYTCTTIITASKQMKLKAIDKPYCNSSRSSPHYKSQSPILDSIDENRSSRHFSPTNDKRHTEPAIRNAFYNKCFDSNKLASQQRYSCNRSKSPFSDESENDAEVREIMRPIPKFCCVVSDEYGRRVRTSFDTSQDSDCDEKTDKKNKTCNLNNNLVVIDNLRYCFKCGHHTPKLCD